MLTTIQLLNRAQNSGYKVLVVTLDTWSQSRPKVEAFLADTGVSTNYL